VFTRSTSPTAVDEADIPGMLRGDARWWAMERKSLNACHPDGAPGFLAEDAATVTKLLCVRLITKGRKIIVCLFVGEEEDHAHDLAVDATRGRHARRQECHLSVAAIYYRKPYTPYAFVASSPKPEALNPKPPMRLVHPPQRGPWPGARCPSGCPARWLTHT
jgi:hypothetical protein